jgi:hypothetical protein
MEAKLEALMEHNSCYFVDYLVTKAQQARSRTETEGGAGARASGDTAEDILTEDAPEGLCCPISMSLM